VGVEARLDPEAPIVGLSIPGDRDEDRRGAAS
jgi:hypothetical protein